MIVVYLSVRHFILFLFCYLHVAAAIDARMFHEATQTDKVC